MFTYHFRLQSQNTNINRLVSTSLRPETVRAIIDQSNCEKLVFIIDSCYSGAVGQSPRSPDVVTKSLEQISGRGATIISATGALEEAIERDDLEHGIFTHYLVKGLEDGEIDYDKDGYISVDELYDYVKKNVEDETKGKQVPTKKGEGKVNIARSIKVVKERET